ncbi:MAG TPA: hypothetical protein VK469_03060 [Candidatus Kapabacteria bacterium]|nr:hypothetical protein [Candidatus Kapabacteria bacterium]
MIKKAKRYFNTSGPNLPQEHYTLDREKLIEKGLDLVKKRQYFTIWAPRQTGKSTYFKMLAQSLNKLGYAKTLGLNEAVYLVFVPNSVKLDSIKECKETIDTIAVVTYIILYDEEKDF